MTLVPSTYRRLKAYLLDRAILFFVWLPLFITLWRWQDAPVSPHQVWSLLGFCFGVHFFYYLLFYLFLSATPGKLWMGLKIVTVNSQAADPWCSLRRSMLEMLDLFFGPALRVFAFLRLDRRHPYDWWAQTQVVPVSPLLEEQRLTKRRPLVASLLFLLLFADGWTQALWWLAKLMQFN